MSVVGSKETEYDVGCIGLDVGVVVEYYVGVVGVALGAAGAACVVEFLDDNLLGFNFFEIELHGLFQIGKAHGEGAVGAGVGKADAVFAGGVRCRCAVVAFLEFKGGDAFGGGGLLQGEGAFGVCYGYGNAFYGEGLSLAGKLDGYGKRKVLFNCVEKLFAASSCEGKRCNCNKVEYFFHR